MYVKRIDEVPVRRPMDRATGRRLPRGQSPLGSAVEVEVDTIEVVYHDPKDSSRREQHFTGSKKGKDGESDGKPNPETILDVTV